MSLPPAPEPTTGVSAGEWVVLFLVLAVFAADLWITRHVSLLPHPKGSPMPQEFDLDALVAQRREAVGGDDVVFTWSGEKYAFPHPLLASDEWKDSVAAAGSADVDQVRAMLGDEQYDRFHAAGGQAGFVMMIVQKVQEQLRDELADGTPTRRPTSSAPRRKR